MSDTEIKKSYWSVTPAEVRYSDKIVDGAKLLYGEITALCNERGYCWATNDYFAELYKNDARTISRWISSLAKEGHVYIDMSTPRRKIFLAHRFDPKAIYDELPAVEKEAPAEKKKSEKKKSAKEKKSVEPKYTKADMEFAQNLLSKIIENFPSFENKQVKLDKWANEIRLLREIDKATDRQMYFMLAWVHGGEIKAENGKIRTFSPHEFWAKNILSADKMRKQWHTLSAQLVMEVRKVTKQLDVAKL